MKKFLAYVPVPVILLYTATLLVCAGLVIIPSSCATTSGTSASSTRTTALHDAQIVMAGIQDVFLVWDAQHQKDIVANAANAADGQAALAAYLVVEHKIVASLDLAYNAIKLASSENDDPSLQAALAAAAAVENDIKTLMGQTPAPAPAKATVKAPPH